MILIALKGLWPCQSDERDAGEVSKRGTARTIRGMRRPYQCPCDTVDSGIEIGRANAHDRQQEPQDQRAAIAQENFGGWKVEDQKAQQGPQRQPRHGGHEPLPADERGGEIKSAQIASTLPDKPSMLSRQFMALVTTMIQRTLRAKFAATPAGPNRRPRNLRMQRRRSPPVPPPRLIARPAC